MVGQNIKNKILPKIFYNFHDELVNNYIDSSRSTIIGKERFVMPVNIEGYMVPSILMIKVLPTLDEGIQFVGFIKEKAEYYCYPYEITEKDDTDEKEHFIIYRCDNLNVVAITQSCYESFGLRVELSN